MALPDALAGDSWTKSTARHILPMLVWCAQHGKKISYGQLDAELLRRGLGHHVMATVYGHPAGAINDTCIELEAELGEKIPPLGALVVNKGTGIPGTGCDYYMATHLGRGDASNLTLPERRAMAEETMEEVWRFPKWDEVLSRCGRRPLQGDIPPLHPEAASNAPRKGGWATGPESAEHKALKSWVANHPQALNAEIPFGVGRTEWLFASADRADVMFEKEEGSLAVEVKAANCGDAELERGIYQCVKYRALLRAELKAQGRIPNGTSLLVTEERLPSDLQRLADLLDVPVLVAPVQRADA